MTVLGQIRFDETVDLTGNEQQNLCLEGTGSLILDRERHMAYACLSPRTSREVMDEWARRMGYDYFLFNSEDENGTPVYHTNVVMHVGTHFAVVCLDSIKDRIPFTPIMLIIVLNLKGTISYAINTDLSRNGSSH